MGEDGRLAAALSNFARTVVSDLPAPRILDQLVDRIMDVVPVTGAGATLMSRGRAPRHAAASSAAAMRWERLQTEVGEGPCRLAHDTGRSVSAPDLATDDRFPAFTPPALADGLAGAFAFPLQQGGTRLGVVSLYSDTPGPLDAAGRLAANTLVDVASAYVANAQAREQAQRRADRFRTSSLYDGLTGLPNRTLMQQRLEHATRRAERSHSYSGLLFIDLDQFKSVNDTYGHEVGDHLLRAVADRLSSIVRPGDTVARMYGDEFVFLCEDLHSAEEVEAVAARVVRAFTQPFVLTAADGLRLTVSASVGLAYAGPGEAVSTRLIVDADKAMYQAKHLGGGSHQLIDLRERRPVGRGHDAAPGPVLRRRAGPAGPGLPAHRAHRGRGAGRRGGAAALDGPQRGPVSPVTMVHLAEQNGLIVQMGAWALRRACADHSALRTRYPDSGLELSVNVSAHQLMAPGFSASVGAILAETGMDPGALILEMTEGVLIDDADGAMTVLTDLTALGVRLALDDFGTGYSGLSYLRQYPVDIVKIDRGFIADIGRRRSGTAIIDAVTNLAHVLDLSVTAEGIETSAQRDEVAAVGCDHAQGYYYADPMAHRDLTGLFTAAAGRPYLPSTTW